MKERAAMAPTKTNPLAMAPWTWRRCAIAAGANAEQCARPSAIARHHPHVPRHFPPFLYLCLLAGLVTSSPEFIASLPIILSECASLANKARAICGANSCASLEAAVLTADDHPGPWSLCLSLVVRAVSERRGRATRVAGDVVTKSKLLPFLVID